MTILSSIEMDIDNATTPVEVYRAIDALSPDALWAPWSEADARTLRCEAIKKLALMEPNAVHCGEVRLSDPRGYLPCMVCGG